MKSLIVALSIVVSVSVLASFIECATTTKKPLSDINPVLIIAGSDASLGQFPFTVSLQKRRLYCVSWYCWYVSGYEHHCGAALIAPNWIATAKHCFNGARYYQQFRVRAGALCWNTTPITSATVDIISLQYAPGTNDFALVKLKSSLSGTYIQPIKIPTSYILKDNCVVSGWGKTNAAVASSAPCLQYASSTIVSNAACLRPASPDTLCAKDSKSSACNGDSGGPLACWYNQQWYLVGLVYYGSKTCPISGPVGYTKVSAFLSFIQSHVGSHIG